VRPPQQSCTQLWSPEHRTDLELVERGQRRPQHLHEDWNPSAGKKGWENCGCSAWRRLQGDLTAAFQYLKGLQDSWRGTFDKGMERQDKG